MGLFDNLFKSTNANASRQLISQIIDNSSVVLENPDRNNKGFLFELLLCSSIHVVNSYNEKKPHNLKKFQSEYLNEIINYAKQNGLTIQIKGDITDFVNDRLILYHNELKFIFGNNPSRIIPTLLAYNFFDTPLTKKPGEFLDLPIIVTLSKRLGNLFKIIDNKMYLVLNN